jgi:hypothetical protein
MYYLEVFRFQAAGQAMGHLAYTAVAGLDMGRTFIGNVRLPGVGVINGDWSLLPLTLGRFGASRDKGL